MHFCFLLQSLKWREKWGIDKELQTWQPPEVLEKHFPSGSTGFDKEGSPGNVLLFFCIYNYHDVLLSCNYMWFLFFIPVIIVPFVGLDIWGLLHSVSKTDVMRQILKHLENYLAIARSQAAERGPNALKVVL